jgi:hypothetical protein
MVSQRSMVRGHLYLPVSTPVRDNGYVSAAKIKPTLVTKAQRNWYLFLSRNALWLSRTKEKYDIYRKPSSRHHHGKRQ